MLIEIACQAEHQPKKQRTLVVTSDRASAALVSQSNRDCRYDCQFNRSEMIFLVEKRRLQISRTVLLVFTLYDGLNPRSNYP